LSFKASPRESGIFDNLLDFSILCQNNAKDQYVGYSTY